MDTLLRACLSSKGVPDACVDSYLAGLGGDYMLYLAEQIVNQASTSYDCEVAVEQYANTLCYAFIGAIGGEVENSSNNVPPKPPSKAWTEFCFKLGATFRPEATGASTVAATPNTIEERFPCGDGDGHIVLCASSSAPAGDFITLAMTMTGPIPLADPMHYHQYGFVFDSDGDPNNNYRAPPAYPNDFFDATDRWYVASYSPQAGWKIEVSAASASSITPVSSDARIVIHDQTLQLLVPASELATSCPGYRFTAFTHLGDYGQQPPYDWSGDVEPPVGEPLEKTCIDFTE